MIGSRISLSVGKLLKVKRKISRSLTTRWAMIPIEGLSGPLWIGGKLLTYSKPTILKGTNYELVAAFHIPLITN